MKSIYFNYFIYLILSFLFCFFIYFISFFYYFGFLSRFRGEGVPVGSVGFWVVPARFGVVSVRFRAVPGGSGRFR